MLSKDVITYYDKSVVKIKTRDGANVGTGFVVTDDGIICTCYHVIGDSDRQELYDGIKIYFADSNIGIDGTILVKDKHKEPYVDHDNDVAFLQISKEDQIKLENSGQKTNSITSK